MAVKTKAQLTTELNEANYGQAVNDFLANLLDTTDGVFSDAAASVSFSAAAGGADVCEVTITVLDGDGNAVAAPAMLLVWLSDAATGLGLTSTAASGTVTAKSASGADFGAITAKKALVAQTLATGVFILEITDTGNTGFYVCAMPLKTGVVAVSDQLVSGDYGS